MALNPWEFQDVALRETANGTDVEARCAFCGDRVLLELREARPALRLGLALLDSGAEARKLGESAGAALEQAGGRVPLLRLLGKQGIALGDLERVGRVALGMALDGEAEGEALEAEWREAEEVAEMLEGGEWNTSSFQEFRAGVFDRFRP
jgi:hypothetical protein